MTNVETYGGIYRPMYEVVKEVESQHFLVGSYDELESKNMQDYLVQGHLLVEKLRVKLPVAYL